MAPPVPIRIWWARQPAFGSHAPGDTAGDVGDETGWVWLDGGVGVDVPTTCSPSCELPQPAASPAATRLASAARRITPAPPAPSASAAAAAPSPARRRRPRLRAPAGR